MLSWKSVLTKIPRKCNSIDVGSNPDGGIGWKENLSCIISEASMDYVRHLGLVEKKEKALKAVVVKILAQLF